MSSNSARRGEMPDHEILFESIEDPSQFAILVDKYQGPFYRRALSIIGNEEDAKDIVQETFAKIYLNATKFELRESSAFSSWAYRILDNTSFAHYRKRKREFGSVSLDETLLPVKEERDPHDELDLTERFILAASKLPEKFARLLKLVIIDNKSYREIAELEGIEENNVRVRIHRAKVAFQKVLTQNPHL